MWVDVCMPGVGLGNLLTGCGVGEGWVVVLVSGAGEGLGATRATRALARR